jgi:hypothetical protein
MRIFQDARYARLVEACGVTMYSLSGNRPYLQTSRGCVTIASNWKHWVHLFPQHGPGHKHERPIVLEQWQQEIVELAPKSFVAGLVHSDGCRSANVIRAHNKSGHERLYSYQRYFFCSASDDIRSLFTSTCDLLGVRWTQMNARNVAVSRRADVAFLDTFIGPKS